VGTIEVPRPLTDPQEVGRAVIRIARAGVDAGEGPLVVEEQRLVARVEVDGTQGVEILPAMKRTARSISVAICSNLEYAGLAVKPLFHSWTSLKSANPPLVKARTRLRVAADVW
jgi:hypothetical protein